MPFFEISEEKYFPMIYIISDISRAFNVLKISAADI